VGQWRDDRDGPMQIVSGSIGKEHIHFEAPSARQIKTEMKAFLNWFKADSDIDLVLKAALAHLWFVTVHPFEDGNGRIARAITDLALARSENNPQRFYSMSAQIRLERNDYYNILERTQRDGMDVTAWLEWFLACLGRAIEGGQTALRAVLAKAKFWERMQQTTINERQRLVLNKLLDGFQDKLTTSTYAKLTKSSHDTALRDIAYLSEKGFLLRSTEGGRSTSYVLTAE